VQQAPVAGILACPNTGAFTQGGTNT